MNNVNVSAVSLLTCEVALFANAVVWFANGRPLAAAGWVIAMGITWRLRHWVIA